MAKLRQIRADMNKTVNGTWFPFELGIEVCIASANNPQYRKARNDLLRPHLKDIRMGTLTNEEILDILKPAFAQHIIRGWKNLEDDNGKPVAFSPEKALEFFNDPALYEFYNFVVLCAGERDSFRAEFVKESEKN